MNICYDGGHGGKDPGAVGKRNTKEKDFVLDIVKKCEAYTVKLGHNAILTRDRDIFLELVERAGIANRANADLLVSIHCNSAEDAQANGIETYSYPGSSKGKEYATKVQANLVKVTRLRNRGVKEANFAVLRHTSMPGILVECGFISNTQEELLLMGEEYRDKVARAIVEAILGREIKVESESHNKPMCLKVTHDMVAMGLDENGQIYPVKEFKVGDNITVRRIVNRLGEVDINGIKAYVTMGYTANR